MKRILGVIFVLFSLMWMLTGCDGGAAVFAPTPLPPDLSPLRYEHPSGAFSVHVPRNWAVYVQNTTSLATATFSPPDSTEPLLTVAVMNLGTPLDSAQFTDLVTQYQTLHRPDLSRYTEQDRQAMGDGSWRMTGIRTLTGGTPQAINTFVDYENAVIGVLEVVITRDSTLQNELQTAINTFTINPNAALQIAELSTLAFVRQSSLAVQNVSAWANPAGALFVTGEVANYGETALYDLPVFARLLNPDGTLAIEGSDLVMGYGIPAGGFAPFSVRFGEGQAGETTQFEVALGTPASDAVPRPFYSGGEVLTWTDDSAFDLSGALIITGDLQNISAQTLHDPIGIVTIFDAQQQVIGAWFAPLATQPLTAGETIPFELRVPEIGGDPQNYILDIQALGE